MIMGSRSASDEDETEIKKSVSSSSCAPSDHGGCDESETDSKMRKRTKKTKECDEKKTKKKRKLEHKGVIPKQKNKGEEDGDDDEVNVWFVCSRPGCKCEFPSKEKLDRHDRQMHTGERFCSWCRRHYVCLRQLERHIDDKKRGPCQKNEPRYMEGRKCPHENCEYRHISLMQLNYHCETEHPQEYKKYYAQMLEPILPNPMKRREPDTTIGTNFVKRKPGRPKASEQLEHPFKLVPISGVVSAEEKGSNISLPTSPNPTTTTFATISTLKGTKSAICSSSTSSSSFCATGGMEKSHQGQEIRYKEIAESLACFAKDATFQRLDYYCASEDGGNEFYGGYSFCIKTMTYFRYFPVFVTWLWQVPSLKQTSTSVVTFPNHTWVQPISGNDVVMNGLLKKVVVQRLAESNTDFTAFIMSKKNIDEGEKRHRIRDFFRARDELKLPPPDTLSMEELEEFTLERLLVDNNIKYAVGQPESFFDPLNETWDLGNLPNDLNNNKDNMIFWMPHPDDPKIKVPLKKAGFNLPQIRIGQWKSVIPLQLAEENLGTLSYMHLGKTPGRGSRIIYSVQACYSEMVKEAVKKEFPSKFESCNAYLRHKKIFIKPTFLQKHKIPYNKAIHKPGQYVLIQPGCFYFGFDLEFNVTETVLFHLPETYRFFKTNDYICYCNSKGFHLPKNLAVKKYQRNSYDLFLRKSIPEPVPFLPSKKVAVLSDEEYCKKYLEEHSKLALKKSGENVNEIKSETELAVVDLDRLEISSSSLSSSSSSAAAAAASSCVRHVGFNLQATTTQGADHEPFVNSIEQDFENQDDSNLPETAQVEKNEQDCAKSKSSEDFGLVEVLEWDKLRDCKNDGDEGNSDVTVLNSNDVQLIPKHDIIDTVATTSDDKITCDTKESSTNDADLCKMDLTSQTLLDRNHKSPMQLDIVRDDIVRDIADDAPPCVDESFAKNVLKEGETIVERCSNIEEDSKKDDQNLNQAEKNEQDYDEKRNDCCLSDAGEVQFGGSDFKNTEKKSSVNEESLEAEASNIECNIGVNAGISGGDILNKSGLRNGNILIETSTRDCRNNGNEMSSSATVSSLRNDLRPMDLRNVHDSETSVNMTKSADQGHARTDTTYDSNRDSIDGSALSAVDLTKQKISYGTSIMRIEESPVGLTEGGSESLTTRRIAPFVRNFLKEGRTIVPPSSIDKRRNCSSQETGSVASKVSVLERMKSEPRLNFTTTRPQDPVTASTDNNNETLSVVDDHNNESLPLFDFFSSST